MILLVVGALQSIAWNLATPAFQGPDESAHFAYVQYLAETGSLPGVKDLNGTEITTGSTEEREALTALNLGSLVENLKGRPAWSGVDLKLWHQIESSLPPGSRSNGAGSNRLARNPPLYYAAMAIPYRMVVWLPLLKRLFVLRLFNALFYLATIVLVWLIAGELFGPSRWKQTLAAGVVALEPQLAFMSAVINSDNLLIALTTAFLLVALRLVKRGPSLARLLWVSGLAAAAVLTHGRGLVLLPVLFVTLVVTWIRFRPATRDTLMLAGSALVTVGVALLSYVLFGTATGNGALYGGQVAQATSGAGFKLGHFLADTYHFYLPGLLSLPARLGPAYGYHQVYIEQFYGAFGSLEVVLPGSLYDVTQVLTALGLIGLYTAVVTRWRQLRQHWPVVVVVLSLLLTTLAFLHYTGYTSLLSNGGKHPLLVGRYLLPLVSLFAVAIAFTLGSLPRRLGALLGAAVLGVGVLLSLTGIVWTMSRFYA